MPDRWAPHCEREWADQACIHAAEIMHALGGQNGHMACLLGCGLGMRVVIINTITLVMGHVAGDGPDLVTQKFQ